MAPSKRSLRELAELSKDPWRFHNEWTFPERDSLDWKNLQSTHGAGRKIAEAMHTFGAELDADDVYSAEGAARLKADHYAKVIAPKYQEFRQRILSDLRSKARTAVAVAEQEALRLPETPFEVAAAMRALDRVHKGVNTNGRGKLTLPKLEQLPPATLRAIAATDPIVSGVSDADHAAIRRHVFEQEGGAALAEAQEFLCAVDAAAESLDYGQAVAELYAKIPNRSPEAEQAAAMRDEIDQRLAPVEVVAVDPAGTN